MKTIYVLLAMLLPGLSATSQILRRDETFNKNDTTANASTRAIAVQADGKIVFYGDNTFYNGKWPGIDGIPMKYGGRLHQDGTWDFSFQQIIVDGRIDDVEIQPWDQKILICGGFKTINGQSRSGIARLNTDGTLDASFDPGLGIAGPIATELRITSIEIRETADPALRRIYVGGDFSWIDDHYTGEKCGIASLHLNGKPDKGYLGRVQGGVIYDMVYDKLHDQLYVGGEFYYVDGVDKWRLARLNADGRMDPTYAIGPNWWNMPGGTVTSMFLNSDGRLLVGGNFVKFDGVDRRALARLDLNGKLDLTFNNGAGFQNGTYTYDLMGTEVRSVLTMSDGSIIAAGNFFSFNGIPCGNVVKIDANGSIDPSVSFGGGLNQCVFDMKLQRQPSGEEKIVLGGFFMKYDDGFQGAIMRLVSSMTLANDVISLKASPVSGGAMVKWTTSTTNPAAQVSIERSVDGIHYTSMYTAGLNVFVKYGGEFGFKDGAVPAGVVYYRVRIQDDSKAIYSNVARLAGSGVGGAIMTVYPNPVGELFFLRSNLSKAVNCQVELYDAKGAILRRWDRHIDAGIQVNQFALPSLTSQHLFIRVRDEGGRVLLVSKLHHIKQ